MVGGLFNLMPIFPLDGGRVVATVGKWRFGATGEVAAMMLSLVWALGVAVVALSIEWWWLAFLGLWLAWPSASALYQMAQVAWPTRPTLTGRRVAVVADKRR